MNKPMTTEELFNKICNILKEKGRLPDILEYENVKDSIVYRLINTEMNRELLDDLPHMEFLDLSVVFCCLVMEEEDNPAFIWIHNIHMKLWDVTVEELYRAASENTQQLEKPEIMNIEEILYDVLPEEGFSLNKNDRSMEEEPAGNNNATATVPMYVLSSRKRLQGAACMLYPDLLRKIADRMDSSYYIIPSSIHELLLIPAAGFADRDELKAMICEINDTHVAPEERLSYSLYGYDRKENKVEILC